MFILSSECVDLLHKKIGYRNDDLYGDNIETFRDVVLYEVFELGNDDIIDTCKKLYTLPSQSSLNMLVESIFEYIEGYFKTTNLFVKWLCAKRQNVIDIYDGTDDNITNYEIPQNILVLSDLGKEGILIVSNYKCRVIK